MHFHIIIKAWRKIWMIPTRYIGGRDKEKRKRRDSEGKEKEHITKKLIYMNVYLYIFTKL